MTLPEIRTATARKLRILADGQALNAEADGKLAAKYTGLHAMLLAESLVIWSVTESVPPKAEQPVIAMLAALSVDEFGVGEPRRSQLLAMGTLFLSPVAPAERQLRKVLAPRYVSQEAPSENF